MTSLYWRIFLSFWLALALISWYGVGSGQW